MVEIFLFCGVALWNPFFLAAAAKLILEPPLIKDCGAFLILEADANEGNSSSILLSSCCTIDGLTDRCVEDN